MNIVTSSDSNFFHCLKGLAASVRKYYGRQVIVYDVGLTNEQKETVDAQVIPINIEVDFAGYATFLKHEVETSAIKTTHKPFCVKHYFENFSEPMIFVDADCAFSQRVQETGFDVGVTLRRKNRIDLTNPWIGILNAGVIFFNTPSTKLVDTWAKACMKDNTTDQKELSEILSETIDWKHYNKVYDWHGLKIKVFNAIEYNDVRLKGGKILHFKGRRHEKGIYERLVQACKQGKNAYDLFNRLTGRDKKTLFNRLLGKSK